MVNCIFNCYNFALAAVALNFAGAKFFRPYFLFVHNSLHAS